MLGLGLGLNKHNYVGGTPTPVLPNKFSMTFIGGVFPVANPNSVAQWNTFFDTINKSITPFHTAQVVGNTVTLIGALGLNLKINVLSSNDFLTSITDTDSIISVEESAFENCFNLAEATFPILLSINNRVFNTCISLVYLYIPACTQLGTSTGNNQVFENITGNSIELTIPLATSTDLDVVYLQSNNTVTLITT